MKEVFVIQLAVVTKQLGFGAFAESVTLIVEGNEAAEAMAERLNQLNDSYAGLYDGIEPVTLMGTPLGRSGTVEELTAHVEDILKNADRHFAEHVGQPVPDTDAELERIRRSKT